MALRRRRRISREGMDAGVRVGGEDARRVRCIDMSMKIRDDGMHYMVCWRASQFRRAFIVELDRPRMPAHPSRFHLGLSLPARYETLCKAVHCMSLADTIGPDRRHFDYGLQ